MTPAHSVVIIALSSKKAPVRHRSFHDTLLRVDSPPSSQSVHRVGRGQPLTDTSPGTIPHICSPSPVLVVSCPPPFKFAQESLCFYFYYEPRLTIKLDRLIVLLESSLLDWFLQVSLIVMIKGRSPMEVSLIVIIK